MKEAASDNGQNCTSEEGSLLAYDIYEPSEDAGSLPGEPETIVFLHGISHQRHAWNPMLPILADRYRLINIDLPGHGESADLSSDGNAEQTLDSALEQVAAFLAEQREQFSTIHLVGNSLGGWIALEMACRGLVDSVTVFSPAGFFRNGREQRRTLAKFLFLRKMSRIAAPLSIPVSRTRVGRTLAMGLFSAHPWRWSASHVRADMTAIAKATIFDNAGNARFTFSDPGAATIPITVGWGSHDHIIPVAHAARVHDFFPHARVELLPGCGHVPMVDDPRSMARLVSSTIER